MIALFSLALIPSQISAAESSDKDALKNAAEKIQKKLGPYVGKVLIFVLVDKRIAKGILLSFDLQNVFIRNKYGDFPLPLGLIREILIVREDPNMQNAQGRRVEPLLDQPMPDSQGAYPQQGTVSQGEGGGQQETSRLPKALLTVGGIGSIWNDTYFRKILAYPWPGSSMKVMDFPWGIDGRLALFFDYTKSLHFEGSFRYLTMKTETQPNQINLFVNKLDGSGHSVYATLGFVLTSPAHLNSFFSVFSKRLEVSQYSQWLKHIFPYSSFQVVSRSNSLKHGSALNKVLIAQDLWGGGLDIGFNVDFGKNLPGWLWKLGGGAEFLHGYTSVNADATDQTAFVWKLNSSLSWEFSFGVVLQIGYSFENEKYFYRKLFLSDPPYEANSTQSGHFFRLAAGYTLY